jgi:hypothetical protein
MFFLWWRMEEEDRGRVWWLYGWFSALMACGSCFGAVAWSARMMQLANFFKGNTSPDKAQEASLIALADSRHSAFIVMYAIEFLCMCAAQLMVLDRLSVFAAPEGTRLQERWAAAGRIVMAVVVLGNAVGLAANAAAAVQYQKAADAMSTASVFYASNKTEDGDDFLSLSQEKLRRGGSIASVQLFCEVAVLLLIVVAFAVVGVMCARFLSSRFKSNGVDAGYDAFMVTVDRTLRRQMLGTTAFIFVTFLLRSVFSTMYAVAFQMRDVNRDCPDGTFGLCGSCLNVYNHLLQWLVYTPELQLVIILVSSPLALLVALWGMTPNAPLQLMKSRKRDTALTRKLMQRKKEEEPSMA